MPLPDRREYCRKWRETHRDNVHRYNITHHERDNAAKTKHRKQLKATVLTYYGNGRLKCVLCEETDIRCLSIDHIGGGGLKHRRQNGIRAGGYHLHLWLLRNKFPDGFRTLCMNCQFKEAFLE